MVSALEHCPVADGRVHGPRGVRAARVHESPADGLRVHATDARHKHLQGRHSRYDLVAQTAPWHDVVPDTRQSVLGETPHDAEREHVVAARAHRRHEERADRVLYGGAAQDVYRVAGAALQKTRTQSNPKIQEALSSKLLNKIGSIFIVIAEIQINSESISN